MAKPENMASLGGMAYQVANNKQKKIQPYLTGPAGSLHHLQNLLGQPFYNKGGTTKSLMAFDPSAMGKGNQAYSVPFAQFMAPMMQNMFAGQQGGQFNIESLIQMLQQMYRPQMSSPQMMQKPGTMRNVV